MDLVYLQSLLHKKVVQLHSARYRTHYDHCDNHSKVMSIGVGC
jgi:hypothetical protein